MNLCIIITDKCAKYLIFINIYVEHLIITNTCDKAEASVGRIGAVIRYQKSIQEYFQSANTLKLIK